MVPLDPRSLLVMGALLAAVAAAVTGRLGADPTRAPGVRWWSLHFGAIAVSLALLSSEVAAPAGLPTTIGYATLSLGMLAYLDAVARFLGERPLPRWLYAALVAASMAWIQTQPAPRDLLAHGLLSALIYAVAARRLWSSRPAGASAQTQLALLNGGHALALGALTLLASLGHPPLGPSPGGPITQLLAVESTIALCLILVRVVQVVAERDQSAARALAERDPLTSLLNRRGLEAEATRLMANTRGAVCVAMADLDHFKRINDRFGHPAGDATLCAVTRVITSELRASDLVGRVGGEEFAFVVPAPCDVATRVLERVRRRVAATRVAAIDSEAVTISFGAVQRRDGEGLVAALTRADRALYEAKRQGRDRLVLTPAPLATSSS